MDYELLKKYEKLVYKIASKFYGEKEDLYQAGFLGLIKAYKNYDKKSNTKFSTYAFNYIYGEIYEEANKRLVKVNKKNLKLYKEFCLMKDNLVQKYSRDFTIEEACKYLKYDASKILSIFNSLSIGPNLDDISFFYINDIDTSLIIKDALKRLKTLERNVIKETYFYDRNQNEIAKKYGITQVKVSRTLKLGRSKIKQYLTC